MVFRRFEDMKVWQEGRELVKAVYAETRRSSFAADWGLRDQMQRAVVSVTSNIAEGYARRGNRELVKFLWIAKGSVAEVQSQLYNAQDLGYIDDAAFSALYDQANLIQVHIFHLIESLSTDLDRQKPTGNTRPSQPPQTSQPPQPSQPSQPPL